MGGFLLLRGGVAGFFVDQKGGIFLWPLALLTTRTYVHSKQVTQEQTKYNKVVHNSNFSILPFPPELADPLEELLSIFFASLSKISSASSLTIRSNPES